MKKLLIFAAIIFMASIAGCRKEQQSEEQSVAATADTTTLLTRAVRSTAVPVSLGNDGQIDRILFIRHDTTLCLIMTLDDDYLDSALTDNRAEQLFILRLAAAQPKVASLIALARGVPANVAVTVTATEEQSSYSFRIPSAFVRTMQLEDLDERARAEVKVINRVGYQNRFYPMELDSCSTLLGMSIHDRYVTFRTEIHPEEEFRYFKQNRDSINRQVVLSLEEQLADSSMRRSLTDIATARFGYRNRYISADRKDSFDISFTPSDLQRLVAISDSLSQLPAEQRHPGDIHQTNRDKETHGNRKPKSL